MIWFHLDFFFKWALALMGFIIVCTLYVYYLDWTRSDDDPQKKHYHPLGILLAPFMFPPLLVLVVFFFLIRAIAYGGFMALFILVLIFIRNAKILTMIQNDAVYVGRRLSEANAAMIRIFSWPWTGSREYA